MVGVELLDVAVKELDDHQLPIGGHLLASAVWEDDDASTIREDLLHLCVQYSYSVHSCYRLLLLHYVYLRCLTGSLKRSKEIIYVRYRCNNDHEDELL